MKRFSVLNEDDLYNVTGGRINWGKAGICGGYLVKDGITGYFTGSVFGTAFNVSRDLITKCGIGPRVNKVY